MNAVDVRTPDGVAAGSVELPEELFNCEASIALIHQVVVAQLAAGRTGNHSTKTRAEVRGGGRKPYRQKGTGRARQGSTRAPQFAGGGVVHGPTPRDYSQRTPKKMKTAALRQILSDRARNERVSVVSEFVTGDGPSTKAALRTIGDWADEGRILAVLGRDEETSWRSLRNVPSVHLVSVDQLNAYDVVVSDRVVFSKPAFDLFIAGANPDRSADQKPEGDDE